MTRFMSAVVAVLLSVPGPTGFASLAPDEFQTLRVGIVVYEGVEMLDFAGPTEVFDAAGKELSIDGRPLFEVVTVAPTKAAVLATGGVTLLPRFCFAERPHLDLLVIPGGEVGVLEDDPAFLDWLRATSSQATVVMSVCNAAFVLAKVGLLDGGEAITFHSFLEDLKRAAPKTRVLAGRRVVDNGRVVTAGGVACGIDGALHVVAKLGGRRLADAVAAYMEYRWQPEKELEGTYQEWCSLGGDRTELLQQIKVRRRGANWTEVEKLALELVNLDPDDGLAWYELGYALLALGRIDEAIAASEESAKFPVRRRNALYNVSSAWGRKGQKEPALDALRRAVDAGWSDRAWTEQDADLVCLHGDPRFPALLDRIGAQGTAGRPEWAIEMLRRMQEETAAGNAGQRLEFLANIASRAPDSLPLRLALQRMLARQDVASGAAASKARRLLASQPWRGRIVLATLCEKSEKGDEHELAERFVLTGIVRDADGKPITAATLQVLQTEPPLEGFVVTGDDGHYELESVWPAGAASGLLQLLRFDLETADRAGPRCSFELALADRPDPALPSSATPVRERPDHETSPILEFERDAQGVLRATADATLR